MEQPLELSAWFKDGLLCVLDCAGFLRRTKMHYLENLIQIHVQYLKTVPDLWLFHLFVMLLVLP